MVPPKKKTAVKKTAVKKTPVKKTPVKKTPVKKKAGAASTLCVQVDKPLMHLSHEEMGIIDTSQFLPAARAEPLCDIVPTPLRARLAYNRLLLLTIQEAAKYLNYAACTVERHADTLNVQTLLDAMWSGTFNWHIVQIVHAILDGVAYKINGQNTCISRRHLHGSIQAARLLDAPVPALPECVVNEMCFEVDSMEDLLALYKTFDAGKPRSAGHRTTVSMFPWCEQIGVFKSHIVNVTNGLKLWLYPSDTDAKRLTPDLMQAIIEQRYSSQFSSVALFLQSRCKGCKSMHRKGVIAAMFATFAEKPLISPEFWGPVADGIGLRNKQDPRWALHNWLNNVSVDGGNNGDSDKKKKRPEQILRACLGQWVRWRKGEKTQVVRIPAERNRVI